MTTVHVTELYSVCNIDTTTPLRTYIPISICICRHMLQPSWLGNRYPIPCAMPFLNACCVGQPFLWQSLSPHHDTTKKEQFSTERIKMAPIFLISTFLYPSTVLLHMNIGQILASHHSRSCSMFTRWWETVFTAFSHKFWHRIELCVFGIAKLAEKESTRCAVIERVVIGDNWNYRGSSSGRVGLPMIYIYID